MKPTRQTRRGQLDQRQERLADARWALYIRPDGIDQHVVRSPRDGSEKTVTGLARRLTFKPGTLVPLLSHTGSPEEVLLGKAPLEGAAEFVTPGQVVTQQPILIFSANPATLQAGTTTTVRLTGAGFRQTPVDVFTAVIWSGALNEFLDDSEVSIGVATFVSATQVDVEVTVDASVSTARAINVEGLRGTA